MLAGASNLAIALQLGVPGLSATVAEGNPFNGTAIDTVGSSGYLDGVEVALAGTWETQYNAGITLDVDSCDTESGTFSYDGRKHYLTSVYVAGLPETMEICLQRTGSGDTSGIVLVSPKTGAFFYFGPRGAFGGNNKLQIQYFATDNTAGGGTGPLIFPITTPEVGDFYRLRVTFLSLTSIKLEMATGAGKDGSGYVECADSPVDATSFQLDQINGGEFLFGLTTADFNRGVGVAWIAATADFSPRAEAPNQFLYIGDSNGVLVNAAASSASIPWAAAAIQGTGWGAVNCAVSSSTSLNWNATNSVFGNVLGRSLAKAARYNPAGAVINLGANDSKFAAITSQANYTTAIRGIIATIRATFPALPIVLCKPSWVDVGGEFDASSQAAIITYGAAVDTIAGDTSGVNVADLYTPAIGGAWLNGSDPVHYAITTAGNSGAAAAIASGLP